MNAILQYLRTNGERLDTEIAEATGMSLATVRVQLAELASQGRIMVCHTIRFEKGKKIEGTSCRLAGYVPPAAPGRKSSKVQLKLS
jgi:DeoR/GlpR family transcriptional regulator of sugar metabolism